MKILSRLPLLMLLGISSSAWSAAAEVRLCSEKTSSGLCTSLRPAEAKYCQDNFTGAALEDCFQKTTRRPYNQYSDSYCPTFLSLNDQQQCFDGLQKIKPVVAGQFCIFYPDQSESDSMRLSCIQSMAGKYFTGSEGSECLKLFDSETKILNAEAYLRCMAARGSYTVPPSSIELKGSVNSVSLGIPGKVDIGTFQVTAENYNWFNARITVKDPGVCKYSVVVNKDGIGGPLTISAAAPQNSICSGMLSIISDDFSYSSSFSLRVH